MLQVRLPRAVLMRSVRCLVPPLPTKALSLARVLSTPLEQGPGTDEGVLERLRVAREGGQSFLGKVGRALNLAPFRYGVLCSSLDAAHRSLLSPPS